jgi:hypothetical protein
MKRSQNFKLGMEIKVLGINKYRNKESAGELIATLLQSKSGLNFTLLTAGIT